MPEYLETTINKSTFKVFTDRYYTDEGVWAKPEDGHIRIGLSEFLRLEMLRRRGFEIKPEGSRVQFGEELVVIETVKAYISLGSPVSGKVLEVNPAVAAITKDPYGTGWLAVLEAINWEADQACLLDAQAYLAMIKAKANEKRQKI
jgi:glycine cleavage system H protein